MTKKKKIILICALALFGCVILNRCLTKTDWSSSGKWIGCVMGGPIFDQPLLIRSTAELEQCYEQTKRDFGYYYARSIENEDMPEDVFENKFYNTGGLSGFLWYSWDQQWDQYDDTFFTSRNLLIFPVVYNCGRSDSPESIELGGVTKSIDGKWHVVCHEIVPVTITNPFAMDLYISAEGLMLVEVSKDIDSIDTVVFDVCRAPRWFHNVVAFGWRRRLW